MPLAQAFRWGLYEEFNDTNYNKKKDIVLLNNEVIANMNFQSTEYVFVEIVVESDDIQWKFVRKAMFKRYGNNINEMTVKQISAPQLTMQIFEEGKWGDIINNNGLNKEKQKYKANCVQETIETMFPRNLSNYFFFDGERWNDLKSKTSDIKDSINTILGVSGLIEMKKHIKNGNTNVLSILRQQIKGTSGEYDRLQQQIKSIENTIIELKNQLVDTKNAIETTQRTYDSTLKTLNDNRKIEDDQKEYNRLEHDIEQLNNFKDEYYADIVKEFSLSAKFFTAGLLSKFESMMGEIDLQGKDIPGVTIDTIDYLLTNGECLCGAKLIEGSEAYDNMQKLKNLVPPEMLGGAAGKLKDTLESWQQETSEMPSNIQEKADKYVTTNDEIIDKESERDALGRTIDRKTNLGPVRKQNQQSKERLKQLTDQKSRLELRIQAEIENKDSKEGQLDQVAQHDKANAGIYRAITYAEALYQKADSLAGGKQNLVITDLNEIIKDNFHRMFNDHEKYARLENDYKIHVYYHEVGGMKNYEEENLSNGETIAINFVFIVSILELAKKYRFEEEEDSEYGMANAILGLPLVLDGPFSALSNENTSLVANRLPEFAEQVIIFMLDKDWEASGLEKYTRSEYCYRVAKESTSNSSSLENE